ncbi:MAG: hypothetical protein L0H37_11005, partial [Nitrosospira sp.]|nr:hypothetical protein [Nitrosospira sp.]
LEQGRHRKSVGLFRQSALSENQILIRQAGDKAFPACMNLNPAVDRSFNRSVLRLIIMFRII